MTSPAEQIAAASYDRDERGAYRPEARAAAVAYYREHGLAAAHQETGVPKPTLRNWLIAAGGDPAKVAEARVEQTRSATEASHAQVRLAVDRSLIAAEASAALVMRRAYTALAQMLEGTRVPALVVMAPRDVISAATHAVEDLARIRRVTAGIVPDDAGIDERPVDDDRDDDAPTAPIRPRTLAELFGAPTEASADLAQVIHMHMRKGPATP